MAVSSAALSLMQYAIMSNDPQVLAITFSLLNNGAVMTDIPFQTKKTLVAAGSRWEGNLPGVNWVPLNTEGVTVSGTPTPYQEQAYIIRNNIDTDRLLVEEVNQIVPPRDAQAAAYLKSVAYDFNNIFINNNHATGNANAPVGLRARLDGAIGVKAANKVDASGVDLSPGGLTSGTANTFVERLDLLLWTVDSPDGTNVVLYMNEVMKARFATAIRVMGTSGGFRTDQDQFGRTIEYYKSAEVRDIGYKADQTTRIITNTETSAGVNGSSTFTSIYAANMALTHLSGWQFEPIQVRDLGLLEAGSSYRTNIEWAGGLFAAHNRSFARLFNIKIS